MKRCIVSALSWVGEYVLVTAGALMVVVVAAGALLAVVAFVKLVVIFTLGPQAWRW